MKTKSSHCTFSDDIRALSKTGPYPSLFDRLGDDLLLIRQVNPLIHNLTNLVAMSTTANILLALGASPIMAHAKEELIDIIHLAKALVINIGTLDDTWITAMTITQEKALARGIPIVLDPVGAGASAYRTETAKDILKKGVQVIRGNASEIMALVNPQIKTKGVDSLQTSEQALASANQLAQQYECTVVVSGKMDLIVDKTHYTTLDYGTSLFTKVVGMGCSLTAVIASFLTVNKNTFLASVHATALFGLVGESAQKKATGPGSFYTQLLDSLYSYEPMDQQSPITN